MDTLERQGAIDRVCAPPVQAFFVANFAYSIIVVCRKAKMRPARYGRKASLNNLYSNLVQP
eukprot:941729-Pleurochrysis_carterae.AAC.1